ncbi:dihydroorotate dehydrogenase [Metabacillus crassostreae]|uniref:dihydroorotate dehydrogenase n=1 Tax=Metabacillus crassostreae TaxID=929098 RepID=UPI0019599305|nr:dihydroorotate dehydrogenase [Metabacillus crassostreae]MBM7606156.1 dihydroorotate dehydrogenase [Metabacillus crassostreae]
MPDWSYHTIFKHIVAKLPGHIGREAIHRGMSGIASIPGGEFLIRFLGHMEPSVNNKVKVDELTFTSSIGLSGKVDPQLSGTKAFVNLGFSFIEIGPVTYQLQKPEVRPHYSKKDHLQIVFPEREESLGCQKTIEKLTQYDDLSVKKLIRIKGNQTELLNMTSKLSPYSDAFIIEYTTSLDEHSFLQLKKNIDYSPLFIAISPKQLNSSADHFLGLIQDGNVTGILLDCDREEDSYSIIQSLRMIKSFLSKTLPIILSGGINEPKDAITFLNEGASLLMLSGGYITSGPGLPKRINELIDDRFVQTSDHSYPGWIWYWLFGFCIFIGGILALLFSMTKVILPYDEAFLGISRNEILAFNELILFFMAHDRMTLAGTMISGGILYMQLARHGVRNGIHWCRKTINIAGVTGFLGILMFIGYGYFDWLHGLFWVILLPLFVMGYRETKNVTNSPKSKNERNHQAWKISLYGQLLFIILGFSFTIGGVIISFIGMTNVFVKTDVEYLCMPPEVINQFNETLIPVIAHDRAGFGSALLSVGLIVLMISLWGFHEGDRWVWWSMLIGGLPAFLSGIIIHYVIGYTTFIHLLPAYIASGLYVFGLLFSYSFLMKTHPDNSITAIRNSKVLGHN